ncbi:lactonase, 7-bladed beta-propeller [Ceratobasidium sp. AG-Ba]|nr:lactonase, 7-bladed beta-propeller [Ceratobasidium sp. AG-Ba]
MVSNSTLYLFLGPIIIPLATALTFLVAADSKSLSAVSFTPPSYSTRASLSILNQIPITSRGPLVSNPATPDVITHGAARYRAGIQQNNVTLSALAEDRAEGCVMELYDGGRSLLGRNEVRDIQKLLPGSTSRLDRSGDVGHSQQVISDGAEPSVVCPERILEHNLGLSVLDSDYVSNFSRDHKQRWELKSRSNIMGARYNPGVSALVHGRFLYLLNPAEGHLTRHFLSDPAVKAQDIKLPTPGSASPIGTLLLSSRKSQFPTQYIYATIDDFLFIISVPNDPSGELHMVARTRITLFTVNSMVLAGPDEEYLAFSGLGGVRMHQRTHGGASIVGIASLSMVEADRLMLL